MNHIEIAPPNNSNMEGVYYIIPLDHFSSKGIRWMRQLVFKAEHIAVPLTNDVYFCRYWGSPKYEIVNCGNTGSFALDGSGWKDCMCDECIQGRIEVKNGWMPQ